MKKGTQMKTAKKSLTTCQSIFDLCNECNTTSHKAWLLEEQAKKLRQQCVAQQEQLVTRLLGALPTVEQLPIDDRNGVLGLAMHFCKRSQLDALLPSLPEGSRVLLRKQIAEAYNESLI